MGLGEPEACADGPRPQACYPLQFLAARSFADFTECKVHPACSTGYRSKVLVSFPQAYSTISVMYVGPTSIRSSCMKCISQTLHCRLSTPLNDRYDNCLTRTANNDAVKCFCIVSCLWIVGWCGVVWWFLAIRVCHVIDCVQASEMGARLQR